MKPAFFSTATSCTSSTPAGIHWHLFFPCFRLYSSHISLASAEIKSLVVMLHPTVCLSGKGMPAWWSAMLWKEEFWCFRVTATNYTIIFFTDCTLDTETGIGFTLLQHHLYSTRTFPSQGCTQHLCIREVCIVLRTLSCSKSLLGVSI